MLDRVPTKSTLTGWQPRVGDLVWQQMYSPQRPAVDSTIEERISAGSTYGDRRRMIVTRIVRDFNVPGLTRWCMRKPGRDLGPAHWSYVESDWCVLEPVTLAEALKAERDAPDMLPLFDLTEHEAREPFPVTDPLWDAPDGAIVDGFVRHGDTWHPTDQPDGYEEEPGA